ncbi:MAG: hypothetical protein HY735_25040 [Verrucomicrobia bacterium]|nr:hypothetical protein [Verrucomicrobiota bacterium]
MSISLNEHLFNLNVDVLKGWLRRMNALDKTLTRKEHFMRAIEQQVTLNLSTIVARLSILEKQLLAESAHQKRLISAREFSAKYGGECPMPKHYYSWREEVSLLIPFIHRGDYHASEPPDLIDSLVEPLRALLPKPEGLKVKTADRVPKAWPSEKQCEGGDLIRPIHVFESERIAPAELGRVLRLIQGGKVKVTDATRRPTDATTRLVSQALVVPDFDLEMPEAHLRTEWDRKWYKPAGPVRAHAWPVLIQQCGWAKPKGGALTLTEPGKGILQQFTPEKFRDGVSRALEDSEFDELNRINHIRGQSGKAKRHLSDPGLRKLAITEAMESFPVGQWLEFKEASRIREASSGGWDVLETDYPALYFFEPQYGCITNHTGLNRQFLRAFFLESLATLGVLDAAFVYPHRLWPDLRDCLNGDLPFCGRYDGLLYVRLNPLGAYALGFADHYDLRLDEKPKLFRVLPNHDLVLADAALNPADRATLELLAVPKSDMVWTLDAERMLSHVETGGAFKELRDFLESNASEGLPGNVQVFFGELENKLGACAVRRDAVLLEWTDAALAQLIATSAGTSKLCHHAGENRLVVPKDNLAAFSRAAKKLGYVLPRADA